MFRPLIVRLNYVVQLSKNKIFIKLNIKFAYTVLKIMIMNNNKVVAGQLASNLWGSNIINYDYSLLKQTCKASSET